MLSLDPDNPTLDLELPIMQRSVGVRDSTWIRGQLRSGRHVWAVGGRGGTRCFLDGRGGGWALRRDC